MNSSFSVLDHVFPQQFNTPELLDISDFDMASGGLELSYHDVPPPYPECARLPYLAAPEEEVAPLALSPFELLPQLAFEATSPQSNTHTSPEGSLENSLDSLSQSNSNGENGPGARGRPRRLRSASSSSSSSSSRSRSSSPERSTSSEEDRNECRKGPWATDEDRLLRRLVGRYGASGWAKLAQRVPGRTGKQCRDRWMNHICPTINRGPWTPAEDEVLLRHQALWGNAWCRIAKLLPNRPYTAIKNRWYGSLRFQADKARRR